MWDFRFWSDFRLFCCSQKPKFQTINAVLMHWKAHLFRHFRLFPWNINYIYTLLLPFSQIFVMFQNWARKSFFCATFYIVTQYSLYNFCEACNLKPAMWRVTFIRSRFKLLHYGVLTFVGYCTWQNPYFFVTTEPNRMRSCWDADN